MRAVGLSVEEPDPNRKDDVESALAEIEGLERRRAGTLLSRPRRTSTFRRSAAAIIFTERSTAVSRPLASRSHTIVAATPCPQPISSTRSPGWISSWSTTSRSRSGIRPSSRRVMTHGSARYVGSRSAERTSAHGPFTAFEHPARSRQGVGTHSAHFRHTILASVAPGTRECPWGRLEACRAPAATEPVATTHRLASWRSASATTVATKASRGSSTSR